MEGEGLPVVRQAPLHAANCPRAALAAAALWRVLLHLPFVIYRA